MDMSLVDKLCDPNNGSKALLNKTKEEYISLINDVCKRNERSLVFESSDFANFISIQNEKRIWHFTDSGNPKVKNRYVS